LKKSQKSPTHLLRLDATILAAAISATIFATAAEYRVWQDVNGRKVEAVFKGVEGDQVNLGLEDGKVLPFPITKLSPADREWLKAATAPVSSIPVSTAKAPAPPVSSVLHLPEDINIILEDRCQDCHEDGTEKGDIRLDNLSELSLDARLDLMNRMQEQVYLGQMPPKKKTQPSEAERSDLVKWLGAELGKHNASKLEDKLRYPSYGNYVNHEKLFNGENKEPAFTPARRWLVSPQIFDSRVRDVFGLKGNDRNARFGGVTNPFALPDASGVRDYDIGSLDGGTLLVMLTNAEYISDRQIRPARVKNGEIGANDFPDPKDKFMPRTVPSEFENIIFRKGEPSDDEIKAAIDRQFQQVLKRSPSDEEMAKYLDLTKDAIRAAGNSEGLRQMLMVVLLESEFLYRVEMGNGSPDQHGRKLLAPREAAFAIAYAMGDDAPDAELLEAAENGKLASRDDFKREVTRLLEDPNLFRGSVDDALSTGKFKSHVVSHPKIIRFFREFFGYPNAPKVFKDAVRAHNQYQNADRGTFGTSGSLVDEADQIVSYYVDQDKNVFENILTTEKFFVYDRPDAEETVEKWRGIWEMLKDEPWKTSPEEVAKKHEEMLRKEFQITAANESKKHGTTLLKVMTHLDAHFSKGLTPFVIFPWQHGYYHTYSPMYNLPGALGSSWGPAEGEPILDYEPVQPFKLENRKGILTHPAWLIAHSLNTENDPVRRGRFVQEKLLAGRVPDVPITVDAVVPEDHTKTLRQRLDKVTLENQECWKCHEYMNPLGLPFELYDDFGRFRVEEPIEHPDNVTGKVKKYFDVYKTLPVDPSGELRGTGNPALDGEVKDAFDLIDRLAKSTRVRQSIIRHAFRFYMGRNEMLSDSQTLIDADNAYVKSGGSFNAVILSLLTSDSFIYRK